MQQGGAHRELRGGVGLLRLRAPADEAAHALPQCCQAPYIAGLARCQRGLQRLQPKC